MLKSDAPADLPIQDWLKRLGVANLADWDVLIFLYRHSASLASAEQIARLLGHPDKSVCEALERLESRQLIKRSRSLHGVCFYQFASSEERLAPDGYFRQLLNLSESRPGRLLILKQLRPGSVSVTAAKEKTK